jgi:hypothetical protein
MNDTSHGYWFPTRRYGWGWGVPYSWKGWAVYIGYFLAISAIVWLAPPTRSRPLFLGLLAFASIVLVAICLLKGERPRWRWGGD